MFVSSDQELVSALSLNGPVNKPTLAYLDSQLSEFSSQ